MPADLPADMPAEPSLPDRYFGLIDQIVAITLKGQLRSKEQIYQMLAQEVEAGTGEIFERCLGQRLETTQTQVEQAPDEAKQARASRSLRAIQAIQGEWERYQKTQQTTGVITTATQAVLNAPAEERLTVWLATGCGFLDQDEFVWKSLDSCSSIDLEQKGVSLICLTLEWTNNGSNPAMANNSHAVDLGTV